MENYEFKIGDEVRIIRSEDNDPIKLNLLQETGEIVYISSNKNIYVVTSSDEEPIKFNETEIELFCESDTKYIAINRETAKDWYKKGGELKAIALNAFSVTQLLDLPKTYEECFKTYIENNNCDIVEPTGKVHDNVQFQHDDYDKFKNIVPCNYGEKVSALMKLLVCRDVYRNNWKPDWKDNSPKYVITNEKQHICMATVFNRSRILSFQSEERANAFVKNFEDLIQEAIDLI